MQLDINEKVYDFKFGVKFIRELDKKFPFRREGMEFGLGLSAKIIPELQAGNISTLAQTLYLANHTEKPKITLSEIDDYLDECNDIELVFDNVIEAIGESNAGKLAMRNFQQAAKE